MVSSKNFTRREQTLQKLLYKQKKSNKKTSYLHENGALERKGIQNSSKNGGPVQKNVR